MAARCVLMYTCDTLCTTAKFIVNTFYSNPVVCVCICMCACACNKRMSPYTHPANVVIMERSIASIPGTDVFLSIATG